jgi:predicted RND superfamily exporter protein
VLASLLVICGALYGASRVKINTYNALETFRTDHPAVETMKLVEQELSGLIPLEVSLRSDQPGKFLEPEVFHQVVAATRSAREVPGVLAGQSYADVFREVIAHWPGRRVSESDRELVPDGEAGRKRLQRTRVFATQVPEVLHYYEFLNADESRARLRLRIAELGSAQTLELIAELKRRLAEQFPESSGIQVSLTGEGFVAAQALTTLIRDLFFSLVTASLVIFSLIALEFRSVRAGLIAALPNLTPLAITLGYMGFRGYDMNVGNVIVFTVCLGLADDNTIHFLYRFREELRRGHAVPDAIQRAFLGTGKAIVATSLLLLAGLGVLRLSNFVPTQRFAELTCVTILGNLLGVLLLLPAWLRIAWREPPEPNEPPLQSAAPPGLPQTAP